MANLPSFTMQIADISAFCMITAAIFVYYFTKKTGLVAGYGRHYEKGNIRNLGDLGPKLSFKWGWIIQESGSIGGSLLTIFVLPMILPIDLSNVNIWAYLVPFYAHYIHRAIIYPCMVETENPLSMAIMASAFGFSSWNGIQQTVSVLGYGAVPPNYWGMVVFVGGAVGNIWHDYELIRLRKLHHEYVVPDRGLFQYTACPNYLCEFIEWFGYVIFSNFSTASVAFFLFTIANMLPRAEAHRKWYHDKFKDYPKHRTILIPKCY